MIIIVLYSYESCQNETTPSFLYLEEIKDLRVLENGFIVLFMTNLQRSKLDRCVSD